MKYFNLYTLLLVFLLGFTVSSFSQDEDKSRSLSDKPTTITKYIVDETGTLTQEQINSLLKKLENFDKQSSTQVVVYMISSLNGESIEDVSYRIAEKNKIGKKGKDNGVLVFIAKNDRMLRIEVGYGLEGVLTDAYTTQIRTKEMNPSFKAGNFFEGINKGVDAIIAVSKGEYKADKKKNNDGPGLMCLGFPVFIIIIFVFIFFSIFMSVLRRIFGWGGRHYTGGSGWGGGGFFGGGGSSWGGGGSSGSFGGFSGGGGSFGGGGSSGSW